MTSFDSVWRKLDRAEQHVDDLETVIIAFHRTDPYHVIAEDDPQTGMRIAKVGSDPDPIPDAVPLILGDAIHAIRSGLDHFAFAANANPPDLTRVAFPIWSKDDIPTPERFQSAAKGQMPTASKQLLEAVWALQPYRGGNGEYLWLINRLDVIDKHRLLVTIGYSYEALTFDGAAMIREKADWTKNLPPMLISIRPMVRYPLEEGTELFSAAPGVSDLFEQNADLKFTFHVAFGEPEILEGEPVVPTLRRLLDEVKGLLERLIPLV
jgi:hypothetical protein